jgi:hypothetical protein
MKKNHATLRCRTCGQSFRATRTPDGGWYTAFEKKPPSKTCRSHRGSPLCRWEVHKYRHRLWKNVKAFFDGLPAAFQTLVPPRRRVAFEALPQISIANEARSLRRLLNRRLPAGTILIGVFDISLIHDQAGGRRERHWVPHFHIVVVGMAAAEVKKRCRRLLTTTELVPYPSHTKDAPSPRGALAYAVKHVGDIRARAIFDGRAGGRDKGKRWRQLKADERAMVERWAQQQTLDDYLLLKGLRRFGSAVKRI